MTPDRSSLHALRGDASASSASGMPAVPRPRRRWLLRGGVPLAIVTAVALLLAWALRDVLVPIPVVDVTPVIAVDREFAAVGGAATRPSEPTVVTQSPGWIEPEPYAITVQAMVPGVVTVVHVLEGQRVEAGQPLIELDRLDAMLALRRSAAELAELEADVDAAESAVTGAEARADEVRDELERLRPLAEIGGVPEGQLVRLESRLRTHEREIEIARAAVIRARAAVDRQQVTVDEAVLALDRHTIVAPVSGVVLARSVVPGTRISMAGDGPGEAHEPGLLSIYDPGRLQVRADVPLSDAGRIGVGTRARIGSEALPDRAFDAEVTRIVHKADIQRNTVQAKLRLIDPDPLLKPEMLVRVRFLGSPERSDRKVAELADSGTPETTESDSIFWVPLAALVTHDGDRAEVTVAAPGPGARRGVHVATPIAVTLLERSDDGAVVSGALRHGDRVVVAGASIAAGATIRVREITFGGDD